MRTFMSGLVFIAVLAAALSWVAAFSGVALSDLDIPAPPVQNEVPALAARFEPSPPAVVAAMLQLAALTAKDVVLDLGSGDGRLVIAAARTAGARGIGIDLDPGLIQQSRAAAEQENVSALVQFLQQDLFQADLSPATVVMLFLSPEANLRLRPRLLAELKPGARIVSHCHSMGDWMPDREARVGDHVVYSWVVPAAVDGSWNIEAMDKNRANKTTIRLKQRFQNVAATLLSDGREIPVTGMSLRGRTIQFTVGEDMGMIARGTRFIGEIEGDRMAGTFHASKHSGRWTAKRTK